MSGCKSFVICRINEFCAFLFIFLIFITAEQSFIFFFFLNNPPPPEIYPLPLHAAFPIWIIISSRPKSRWRAPSSFGRRNAASSNSRPPFILHCPTFPPPPPSPLAEFFRRDLWQIGRAHV